MEDKGVIVFGVISVSILMGLLVFSMKERSRLLDECMSDGHKEYVCIGMIDND